MSQGYRLLAAGFVSGREERAEQARNYPSQRIFQNQPPYGKDRQSYPLNLTVFWFRLARISKKTVRNAVNLSGNPPSQTCSTPYYFLCYSIGCEICPRD